MASKKPIVETYRGSQTTSQRRFKRDAEYLAKKGYLPVSEQWTQDHWGCGAFIVALLLCFLLIGFIVFLYMIIVKPAGRLTVTYEYIDPDSATIALISEKTCPRCAETVKAAAKVCKHCGHEFEESQT